MFNKLIQSLFPARRRTEPAPLLPFAAASETESSIARGLSYANAWRDRYAWDRRAIFDAAIRAWRLNPLARDLTRLYRIFVTDGLQWSCDHQPTADFLRSFYDHPLNRLAELWPRYATELHLTGNAFTRFTVQESGMCFVRGIPADMVSEILTAGNDIEQETGYQLSDLMKTQFLPAYQPESRQADFILHHSINRLLGCTWGEPEIAPEIPWLERYATFLEHRLRLNQYRNAFLWDVSADYPSEMERQARAIYINSHPPIPGQVNIHPKCETWQALAPQLHSGEAQTDGLSIKKFIAAGAGLPLHYLAEPESATRTTAEAAGTPAFKTFEEAQAEFKRMVLSILRTAVQVRARSDKRVRPQAAITVTAADPTERDNASLALAVARITAALTELFDRELISSEELLRFVYRFGGETLPAGFVAPEGRRKPLTPLPIQTEDDRSDPADPVLEPSS